MIKTFNPKRFGELLREVRIMNNISQNRLAEKAGISSETIRRIEKQHNIPKIDVIDSLSRVLKTDLQLLFLELKKVNPLSNFCKHIDQLVLEYNVEALSTINNEFDEIKANYKFANSLEKNEIDQLDYIIKGLEESYRARQAGSHKSFEYYLSAIKLTVPEFDVEKINTCRYNYIELKCLLLLALECNALSQYKLSNDLSLFLICQIEKYNVFQSLDNTDLIKVKVIQNIAYNYHCLDQDQSALEYAQKGIDLCIEQNSMYLLFALYYRKATALYFLNADKCESIKNFKYSVSVLELLGKEKLKDEFIRITEEKYHIQL